ncbi:hypothetical protein BX666DRAFT_2030740 [Dichotomocladium elegans]|nr:hypothetical protein BX666DRAFT_2030740 [Dichotomocladium elegans]
MVVSIGLTVYVVVFLASLTMVSHTAALIQGDVPNLYPMMAEKDHEHPIWATSIRDIRRLAHARYIRSVILRREFLAEATSIAAV